MSESPAPEPDTAADQPASRWGNIAWFACSSLIVLLVVGFWLRVHDQRAGTNLSAQIADHRRPIAPSLAMTGITGDGAPGLPAWYRAVGHKQLTSTVGAQPIVVNWWASWCGPCVDEAPILRQVANDYRGRVTFVGMDAGNQDLESDARAFVKEHRLTFSIVRADKSDGDAWGVHKFPETFIIGTDGRVSAHIPGPVEESELRDLLDSELRKDRTSSAAPTKAAAS